MCRFRRADRLADADLARPLGDRHQHDVHHADAADEQRDRCDRAEQTVNTEFDAALASRSAAWLSTWKSAVVDLVASTSSVEVISADAASEAPRDFACTVMLL